MCGEVDGIDGETFNFGTGEEHVIGDVVDQVLAILGKRLPVVSTDERQRPEASEVERLLADASKARARLPWEPQVAFADGLERTVAWVERSIDAYRPSTYAV